MNWHCKFRSILLPFFGEFSPKGVWALFITISLFIPFLLFITSKLLPCPPSFLSVQSQRDSYCWCFLQRVSTSIKFYSPQQYRISSDQGVLSHDCDRKRWTSTPNRLKKQVNALEVFFFSHKTSSRILQMQLLPYGLKMVTAVMVTWDQLYMEGAHQACQPPKSCSSGFEFSRQTDIYLHTVPHSKSAKAGNPWHK